MSASIDKGNYPARQNYMCGPKSLRKGFTLPMQRCILPDINEQETGVLNCLLNPSQTLGEWKAMSGYALVAAITDALGDDVTPDMAYASIQRLVDLGHIKRQWEDEGRTPAHCLSEDFVAKLFAYTRSVPSD